MIGVVNPLGPPLALHSLSFGLMEIAGYTVGPLLHSKRELLTPVFMISGGPSSWMSSNHTFIIYPVDNPFNCPVLTFHYVELVSDLFYIICAIIYILLPYTTTVHRALRYTTVHRALSLWT